jgi:hypothetical protein
MTAPAEGAAAPRVLVVSASDSRFMPFLRGMLATLRPALNRLGASLAILDIGLGEPDRAWLAGQGAQIAIPHAHLGVNAADHGPALLSFLARPFLPEYFPGHDVYAWVDSDIWFQRPEVLDAYVAGALARGMAITHERERAYRFQPWLFGWTSKHFALGYAPATAAWLLSRPHLNAGFFAVRADGPHWSAWARRYEAAIKRSGKLVPHDQFALNHALHGDPFGRASTGAALLDPGCNWICDRGVPVWNDDAGAFCKPYAPYEVIGALHLAGPAKWTVYPVRRTGGGTFSSCLVQGASPATPVTEPLLGRQLGPGRAAA